MAGRVLITGGRGQLASALGARGAGFAAIGLDPVVVGRPGFDFDRPESLDAAFAAATPNLVVNAAAWTAVDAAESAPDAAYRANRDGPARLAALCAASGVPLIHLSTDYVFDGLKGAPYRETDPVSPTGVYGHSKRAGEEAVLGSGAQAVVVRTAWVYAARGRNFVLSMLEAARTRDRLRVVADQRGCPTEAGDLADAVIGIAARLRAGWAESLGGVVHAVGAGDTTWHGLAVAAIDRAARHGHPRPPIDPIATADWPTPARRPPDSRLDCGRLAALFGLVLPCWEDSLARMVDSVFAVPGGSDPDM